MVSFLIFLFLVTQIIKGCVVEEESYARVTNDHLTPTLLKPYMGKVSLIIRYNCDAINHIPGRTYLEISNFLHSYVVNKKNMHPGGGQCREECDRFQNTKTYNCGRNKWCLQQPPCPNIFECRYFSSTMEVCLGNMTTNNRRYEYVRSGDRRKILGRQTACQSGNLFHLESQERYLFHLCHYCLCLCDEGATPNSDIFVSLRTARSNTAHNRVVTGVRFVKRDHIVHFQVQEGKLMPEGKIDPATVSWVPVAGYKITDDNIREGVDYHKLTWKYRSVHLDDVLLNRGYGVTGVRFRRVGIKMRLHLEIEGTRFNHSTGRLTMSSYHKMNPDKLEKELKLDEPDVPISLAAPSTTYTTNQYVQFTHSDLVKDGAQTTVPFLDAQPITSRIVLSGIGIFHKGSPGSGGFIAPVIFTYRDQK